MRVFLKPKDANLDFPRTCFDIEINSTVDHLISFLTLKYNTIDATTLTIYHRRKALPFEGEIYKLNIMEDDELEVGLKESKCCEIV